jgi:hypothetical protein
MKKIKKVILIIGLVAAIFSPFMQFFFKDADSANIAMNALLALSAVLIFLSYFISSLGLSGVIEKKIATFLLAISFLTALLLTKDKFFIVYANHPFVLPTNYLLAILILIIITFTWKIIRKKYFINDTFYILTILMFGIFLISPQMSTSPGMGSNPYILVGDLAFGLAITLFITWIIKSLKEENNL